MTSVHVPEDVPDDGAGGVPARGAADLDAAAAQLRGQPSELSLTVADRALVVALAVPRPARLVRSWDQGEALKVSTVAIVALLRERLDGASSGGAVRRVVCDVSREEQLGSLTVELIGRYGDDLRALAHRARTEVDVVLGEALGPAGPGQGTVVHVHVADVTVGDPVLVDPGDEVVDAVVDVVVDDTTGSRTNGS